MRPWCPAETTSDLTMTLPLRHWCPAETTSIFRVTACPQQIHIDSSNAEQIPEVTSGRTSACCWPIRPDQKTMLAAIVTVCLSSCIVSGRDHTSNSHMMRGLAVSCGDQPIASGLLRRPAHHRCPCCSFIRTPGPLCSHKLSKRP